MTVAEMADRLRGDVLTAEGASDVQVGGGYVSDLLSDVIAHSRERDVWVTLQRHVNVVAVAQLKGLAAVVLVNGRRPDPDTTQRAEENGIPIVSTPLSAFEAAGTLYALGLRGSGTP